MEPLQHGIDAANPIEDRDCTGVIPISRLTNTNGDDEWLGNSRSILERKGFVLETRPMQSYPETTGLDCLRFQEMEIVQSQSRRVALKSLLPAPTH